jgi:hypothetical protein
MNMIDEDVLANVLNDVAKSFKVSPDAARRIVTEVESTQAKRRQLHAPTFIRVQSRTRVASIAAAILLVVGGTSFALLHTENGSVAKYSAIPLAPNTSGLHSNASGASALTVQGTKTLTATGSTINTAGSGFSATSSTTSTESTQKIESTGVIALTINRANVGPAFSKLSQLVASDGGFVSSTRAHIGTRSSGHFSYGTIVLQVPQPSFAKLINQVQHVGRATSVSSNSDDVTSQYVGLSARIRASEASRTQYLAIMQRATTISGILAVQSQLNTLQSQIEQLQGQLNVLNNATTYGALTVTLTEAGLHTPVVHAKSGIAKAWHDSVRGFIDGFEWLIKLAGPALFALLLLGALSILGRLGWRAYRRRRI